MTACKEADQQVFDDGFLAYDSFGNLCLDRCARIAERSNGFQIRALVG